MLLRNLISVSCKYVEAKRGLKVMSEINKKQEVDLDRLRAENAEMKDAAHVWHSQWEEVTRSGLEISGKYLQLEKENAELRRELDVAVRDIEKMMAIDYDVLCDYCSYGQCYRRNGTGDCRPKYRGPERSGEDATQREI